MSWDRRKKKKTPDPTSAGPVRPSALCFRRKTRRRGSAARHDGAGTILKKQNGWNATIINYDRCEHGGRGRRQNTINTGQGEVQDRAGGPVVGRGSRQGRLSGGKVRIYVCNYLGANFAAGRRLVEELSMPERDRQLHSSKYICQDCEYSLNISHPILSVFG